MRNSQFRNGNQHVLYNQAVLSDFSDSIFDITPGHRSVNNTDVQGRGTVVFFAHADHELVLKHYHRGGLAGVFVKDSYLFVGASRSRMWREYNLLSRMRDMGLPVPKPIAARCIRSHALCYQGDLILERIPNARTLAEVLSSESLPEKMWESIGSVIRRFHQNKVDHADLNACNILLTEQGQIYLIDFDKSRIHNQCEPRWRNANLSRLRRSLQKWKNRDSDFRFSAKNWLALERGYEGARKTSVRSNTAATDLVR
jgi:3-deoxy-D-manno-octulosonic acid kinase